MESHPGKQGHACIYAADQADRVTIRVAMDVTAACSVRKFDSPAAAF